MPKTYGGPQQMAEVLPAPIAVMDKSLEHAASIPWIEDADGKLYAVGFNEEVQAHRNHACVEITYNLEEPGSIAYGWKVSGCDHRGLEIFDRYWYLKSPNGTFRSGEDFWAENEDFTLHVIDDLSAGTYTLTIGLFCLDTDGSATLDLNPACD